MYMSKERPCGKCSDLRYRVTSPPLLVLSRPPRKIIQFSESITAEHSHVSVIQMTSVGENLTKVLSPPHIMVGLNGYLHSRQVALRV